jgi:DNA-binding NtrC family response regulator
LEPKKILIIDDDVHIRDTYKILLSAEGFLVDTAETGEEAIRKTQEKWYNAALIDIRLPDTSGIELLPKLKDGSIKTRRIVLTGYPTLPNAVAAVNNQADAYLIKPVQISKMLETINQQLDLQENEITFGEAKIGEFMKNRAKQFLEKKRSSTQ